METVRALLVVVATSLATLGATAPPAVLGQGEHAGTVEVGVVETVAVDLDGSQARARLRYELPAEASGLTSTLRWSPATDPTRACTQNESVLDGSLDDRTALDSRRTDTPDPADPCTQPGRHLLTVLVEDPNGSLPEGATVPYTLVLSTFGGPADVADAAAVATEPASAPPSDPASSAPTTEDAAATDPALPLPALAGVVAVALGALLVTRMRRTWRAADGDRVLGDAPQGAAVPPGVPDEAFVRPDRLGGRGRGSSADPGGGSADDDGTTS